MGAAVRHPRARAGRPPRRRRRAAAWTPWWRTPRREGTLNVIALPPDWANYGSDHQGVHRTSTASTSTRRTPTGPARTRSTPSSSSAPRTARPTCSTSASRSPTPTPRSSRPTRWPRGTRSPRRNKDPNGAWVNDYGGYISIGCNAKLVATCPTTFADLAQARVQGPGRAERRPHPGRGGVRRACGRRRWPTAAASTGHPARRRLLGQAGQGGQPAQGRPQLGHDRERPDADRARLGLPQRHPGREGARRRSTGRSPCRRTACSPSTTRRRSTRTRRTRRRPGSGRSSSTPTRGRTSGWPGKARPVRLDAMTAGGHGRQGAASRRCPQVHGRAAVPHAGADGRGPAGRGQDLGSATA